MGVVDGGEGVEERGARPLVSSYMGTDPIMRAPLWSYLSLSRSYVSNTSH